MPRKDDLEKDARRVVENAGKSVEGALEGAAESVGGAFEQAADELGRRLDRSPSGPPRTLLLLVLAVLALVTLLLAGSRSDRNEYEDEWA
jgi:hypothetical protein